ncbi:MAG TPA: HWE histidine kinase domain-containing protein [Candidatus Binatia bacterium]|nr:HWE histidine kinase domain-containing protein [Candidatus Binatia bacterium]
MASDSNALVGLQRALPRTDSIGAYLTAGAIAAFATLIKFPLDDWAGEALPPYITFYPAVVIASLYGGPRVGFATAAATLLLAWYIWLPTHMSFAITGARTPLTIGIYAFSSALLAWIVGLARLVLDQVVVNEAERALSARESVHRIKNLIAVVQALAAKIAREVSTPEEYRQVFIKRLEALGVAQNVLVREDWSDIDLKQLIDSALAPFLPNPGLAVKAGPDLVVPARHVNGLCLALYELSTNAMKYGALANGEGPVSLSWRCENDDCVLEWREARKGNASAENSGFGSLLIKTALSNAPNTHVNYEFTPSEVVAVFRWPTPTTSS